MDDQSHVNNRVVPGVEELSPLYTRINWAALFVPPIGVILLMVLAIYVYPYFKEKTKRSARNGTPGFISREEGTVNNKEYNNMITEPDFIESELKEIRLIYQAETLERLISTPRHKQVVRTTPLSSPKAGRYGLSTSAPIASLDDINL